MLYEVARPQINCGDVLLFSGKGIFGQLIQRRTKSVITHAGFAFWCNGRLFCLEARERRGVRIYPLSMYLKRGHEVRWYRLLDDQYGIDRDAVVSRAFSHVGKEYAHWFQFLRSWGVLTPRICDAMGIPADTDIARMFCSELVVDAILWAGYIHPLDEGPLEPAKTEPGKLPFIPPLKLEGVLTYGEEDEEQNKAV